MAVQNAASEWGAGFLLSASLETRRTSRGVNVVYVGLGV